MKTHLTLLLSLMSTFAQAQGPNLPMHPDGWRTSLQECCAHYREREQVINADLSLLRSPQYRVQLLHVLEAAELSAQRTRLDEQECSRRYSEGFERQRSITDFSSWVSVSVAEIDVIRTHWDSAVNERLVPLMAAVRVFSQSLMGTRDEALLAVAENIPDFEGDADSTAAMMLEGVGFSLLSNALDESSTGHLPTDPTSESEQAARRPFLFLVAEKMAAQATGAAEDLERLNSLLSRLQSRFVIERARLQGLLEPLSLQVPSLREEYEIKSTAANAADRVFRGALRNYDGLDGDIGHLVDEKEHFVRPMFTKWEWSWDKDEHQPRCIDNWQGGDSVCVN